MFRQVAKLLQKRDAIFHLLLAGLSLHFAKHCSEERLVVLDDVDNLDVIDKDERVDGPKSRVIQGSWENYIFYVLKTKGLMYLVEDVWATRWGDLFEYDLVLDLVAMF